MSPSVFSLLGQCQGSAGRQCPAGRAAQRGVSPQVHFYPRALACPRLTSRFPAMHPAPHPVALSAEDLTDRSGLDLPCPHRDQRGLVCCGGTWGLADVQRMAMAPDLPYKAAQASMRSSLQSSGSRHTSEGACAGREVVSLSPSPYEIVCVVTCLQLTALALASKP